MMDANAMLALYLGAKGLAGVKAPTMPEPELDRLQHARRRISAVRVAELAPANSPAHGLSLCKPSALPGAEAGDLAA